MINCKFTIPKIACFLLIAAGLNLRADGVLLPYETDFQNVPGPYGIDQSIVGQEGWTLYAGKDSDATIIGDPTGGGKAQVLSLANGGGVRNYFKNTLPGEEDILVSYQTYAGEGENVRDHMAWLFVVDNASKQIAGVAIDAAGDFVLNDTHKVAGVRPVLGVWYTVSLKIKRATQTLDLQISDGTSSGSVLDVPYQFPSVKNQLGMIGLLSGVYKTDAVVYIADVKVVPDSMSSTLNFRPTEDAAIALVGSHSPPD